MKFKVQQAAFYSALQSAGSAVPNKSTLQVLNNFLLRLEGNVLEVAATDMDLGIRLRLEVEGLRNGAVVVNARRMLDLVKALSDQHIEISVDDYLVRFSWRNKGQANLAGFDAADFPDFPVIEGESFTITKDVLAFLAEKTVFAISTDSTRQNLAGVYLDHKEDKLCGVATDGHRLGRAFLDIKVPKFEPGIIVPPKAISHITRSVKDDANIEVRFSESYILFAVDHIQVVSKLIEGPYPRYEGVIPKSFEREVQVNRAEFMEVLRHVSAVANQRTRQIRLHLDGNQAEVSASDPNIGGDCRESLAVNHTGEGVFDIGFNGHYLQEILNLCACEEVLLQMNSPVGACIVRPVGEGLDFYFLIMPLRLADEG